MTEATAPSTIAPNGPLLPAAGVTATRPAMMPEQKPRAEPLWPLRRSAIIQKRPADAVVNKVLILESAAEPFDSCPEPQFTSHQPQIQTTCAWRRVVQ